MPYCYHVDPGHGWIEVPYIELVELGIQREITNYSYRAWETCYLEEDCDATKWEEAYLAKHGKKPTIFEERYDAVGDDYCFIRELDNYYVSPGS